MNTKTDGSNVLAAVVEPTARQATEALGALIQPDQYVGETWNIDYERIAVQVHDFHREKAGGVPMGCFLVATRMKIPIQIEDWTAEDSSVILLRVLGPAQLWNSMEMDRIRSEAGKRAFGSGANWDEDEHMDVMTAQDIAAAGLSCRILGTFYMVQKDDRTLSLTFGSDLSNFYPNRGLKVYKPNKEALEAIVNYRDRSRMADPNHPLAMHSVRIGRVRYGSTDRPLQGVDEVPVSFVPLDLLAQKTAVFGMTRMGKSNSTKIVAQSMFRLRFENPPVRVGQLIVDYNGEYANENPQDLNALKGVWRVDVNGDAADVVTYGTMPHPQDPNRVLMKINFFDNGMLQIGKEIIDEALEPDKGTKYIGNFRDVIFEEPDPNDHSATTRYRRAVLAYRALLSDAGLAAPANLRADTTSAGPRGRISLFNQQLIAALQNSQDDPDGSHAQAAAIFGQQHPTWPHLAEAFKALRDFIKRGSATGYTAFNATYMARPGGSGDRWDDQNLIKIIGMWEYANGPRLLGRVAGQHSPNLTRDYADQIYDDLAAGKLVIIDQSQGSAEMNKMVADRTMETILRGNQTAFSTAQVPPDILVYVEEAHNLLPQGSDDDLTNVWVRTAKEGAKLHIGLVYATQEVSSIQKNILKNTANWFIGHLNNTDETKEIAKFYDFADFVDSIKQAEDRGFLRVKTISNRYIVPVMIDRFEIHPVK
ncbi:MAG TPA: DUF87 domain-containing protein [Candidatus Acidoferrales bacterium]|nr:DUF87 domain-containing protein [Candidatus Acidoferrales bacterium]